MTSLYALTKCADRLGYAVRTKGGLHALIDVDTGGATHAHDALGSPYSLDHEDLEAEIARPRAVGSRAAILTSIEWLFGGRVFTAPSSRHL